MKHIQLFEEHIQSDKGYLGDGVGIMYHPELHIMYIGSSENASTNYTIIDIMSEDEVFQIKELLKNIKSTLWKNILTRAGYEVLDGGEYFRKIKEK
jgi:hypothetical protein